MLEVMPLYVCGLHINIHYRTSFGIGRTIRDSSEMDVLGYTDDPYSFAKPEFVRVIETHLELNVNFTRRVLEGKAILTIEKRRAQIHEVILDNYKLVIKSVRDFADSSYELNYKIGIHHEDIGSLFRIQLPNIDNADKPKCKIVIEYETQPNSPALYWLTPAQTADGKHPFLLSNNKLIYARSMFPCQDTPSFKSAFTAKISAPLGFTVLMSALLQRESERSGLIVYEFLQVKPIPSNAVIIAVGVLEKRQLNARTNIYAESTFIVDSYSTFNSGIIERMLRIAEDLCGFYVWDRYDLCVFPPSISHFEIECPCLTFVSPALLRGDSSCISSLSLKISQSWAGILVTCANYNHLWLSKSFSLFLYRKIMCRVMIYDDLKFYFQRVGLYRLNKKMYQFGHANLVPNLVKGSPHDAIKYVPYELGCVLLNHLEVSLGGNSVFERFLKSYFHYFAYKSICTKDWMDFLYARFPAKIEELNKIEWNKWFMKPVPPFIISRMSTWETNCDIIADEWVKLDERVNNIPSVLILKKKFCDIQKLLLLNSLHNVHLRLTEKKLQLISNIYNFNNESGQLQFIWLLLCIKVRWVNGVLEALNGTATKFLLPNYLCLVFEALYKWTEMRSLAIEMYTNNKEKMLAEIQKPAIEGISIRETMIPVGSLQDV